MSPNWDFWDFTETISTSENRRNSHFMATTMILKRVAEMRNLTSTRTITTTGTRKPKTVYSFFERTSPHKSANFEPIHQTYRLPGVDDRQYRMQRNKQTNRKLHQRVSRLLPKLQTKNALSVLWSFTWLTRDHKISNTSLDPRFCLPARSGNTCGYLQVSFCP